MGTFAEGQKTVRSMFGISGGTQRNMSTKKQLTALVGAGALTFAMFGTSLAGVTVWATVDGHEPHSAADNNVLT